MAKDQENVEFVNEETGEAFQLNTTSLVSNVRDVLLSRRKMQTEATVWSKLSEKVQKDEITAVQELARELVGKVVELVAEKGMTCAHVEVSKFAVDVDKGVVTITSSGYASDEMLTDLAHAKGKTAKLTIVDAQQFNQKSTMVKPEPDQPDMLGEDTVAAAEDPDAEIEAAAAEMDAQLDDVDDLHADDETPAPEKVEDKKPKPAAKPKKETAKADPEPKEGEDEPLPGDQGADAAIAGEGKDANPFDGGTGEHQAWANGYNDMLGQMETLKQEGYEARKDGMAPTRCTWKKGTNEHTLWMEGYTRAKSEETD